MRTYRKFKDALIDELRTDPEYASVYLQLAFEEFERDGDTDMLLLSLRNIAEAQGGIPALARKVKLAKTSLYKALSEDGNPTLSTMYTILKGLGYTLRLAVHEEQTLETPTS